MLKHEDLGLMKLKGRVTAYLPEEIQRALEQWAEEESRSLSSLATYLLTQAVKERQQQQNQSN
ncbi:ribbon-helix-helix domain-containing protein [Coleofasciculus sp. G2-EDA-02]|uniref:ribbon-helix-helix domain-containing protein n=1 Tax=Coleofasciculus sp. G2-EDA-02 TaxID=3069529 RepID=UPI0032FDB5E6